MGAGRHPLRLSNQMGCEDATDKKKSHRALAGRLNGAMVAGDDLPAWNLSCCFSGPSGSERRNLRIITAHSPSSKRAGADLRLYRAASVKRCGHTGSSEAALFLRISLRIPLT